MDSVTAGDGDDVDLVIPSPDRDRARRPHSHEQVSAVRSVDHRRQPSASPLAELLLPLIASVLFLVGALCTYRIPSATAPCYIGGSLLMIANVAIDSRPRLKRNRPPRVVDGWFVLVVGFGAVVVALAFVVGFRLRLGS